jgi:hypothetical protein
MLGTFMAALVLLTVVVLVIKRAARNQDVLSGRFFERSNRKKY